MPPRRQTPSQREFLQRVRKEVRSRGYSLRVAAQQVGCSASNLSRLFSGKVGLSADVEDRLARSFIVEEVDVESVIEIVRGLRDVDLKLALQFLQIMQRLRGNEAAN